MLLEHDVNGVTRHANPGAALGYEICIMLPRMLPKTPSSGGLTKSDLNFIWLPGPECPGQAISIISADLPA
jgi:hypothetical protein